MLLLDSDTDVPPDGAGPVSVTVPVDVVPARTAFGFTSIDASCGALMDKVAVRVTLLKRAETLTLVFVATGVVPMANVAV